MPDIHFNCSRCTQRLVVDAGGIGLTVPCPTCKFPLVIPPNSSPRPVVVVPVAPVTPAPALKPPILDNSRTKDEDPNLQKLTDIVLFNAKELECEVEREAAVLIARSSNGIPADATRRLLRVLQYDRSGTLAPVVTVEAAEKALKKLFPENQETTAKTGKS